MIPPRRFMGAPPPQPFQSAPPPMQSGLGGPAMGAPQQQPQPPMPMQGFGMPQSAPQPPMAQADSPKQQPMQAPVLKPNIGSDFSQTADLINQARKKAGPMGQLGR